MDMKIRKNQKLRLQQLFDNAIDNAKILKSDKDKLHILVEKEDIVMLSIAIPDKIASSVSPYLSNIDSLLVTANVHNKKLNQVLSLLEKARKIIIK